MNEPRQTRAEMVLVDAIPRVFRRTKLQPYEVGEITDAAAQIRIAQDAERAKLDGIFVVDFIGLDRYNAEHGPVSPFEPMTELAAMAACTERVGLIGTMSTLFNFPYNVARQFASLEHFSGGRSGWNIVTSFKNEGLFGYDELPAPGVRYAAAQEFVDVVDELWDSWDEDAVVADPERGIWADMSKVRDVDFVGEYHKVRGGLDSPRSPQGRPVMMQAGASDEGIEFAGRNAEVIFAGHPVLDMAAEYYERVKTSVEASGRTRDKVVVLTGAHIYLGDTEEAAWEHARAHAEPEEARVAGILIDLRGQLPGFSIDGLDWDAPVPDDLFPSAEEIDQLPGRRSRTQVYRRLAMEYSPTLRHFLDFTSIAGAHTAFIGTVETVADQMEKWFRSGGCDGFVFLGGESVATLDEALLPELRRRGLFREDYSGVTLRDHLGLPA